MSSAPQHVMSSAFECSILCDTESMLQKCRVPLLVRLAAQSLSDVPRLWKLRAQAVIRQTGGAGHFHDLEVSAQVDAMFACFFGDFG